MAEASRIFYISPKLADLRHNRYKYCSNVSIAWGPSDNASAGFYHGWGEKANHPAIMSCTSRAFTFLIYEHQAADFSCTAIKRKLIELLVHEGQHFRKKLIELFVHEGQHCRTPCKWNWDENNVLSIVQDWYQKHLLLPAWIIRIEWKLWY